MTHRERVLAVLRGAKPDRVPVSMWRHFFSDETSAEGLAGAMLAYQESFDWDFMKVNPRASYHVEDWGVKVRYSGNQPPLVASHPVRGPGDWSRITRLDPAQGVLAQQLRAIDIIAKELKGRVPFVMTMFTPLSIASRLAPSEDLFLEHLRSHRDQVSPALDAITETFIAFSKECLARGASGIFLATTAWATTDRLTTTEYAELARPHDLRLLAGVAEAEFNILHVCREQNMLRLLADYPVQAFNWDCWGAGNPSLLEGSRMVGGKAVIGGVLHGKKLEEASPDEITSTMTGLRTCMQASGWMIGPGCTYQPGIPEAVIRAVRNAAG